MELGRNLESIRRQATDWTEKNLVSEAAERAVKETLLTWLPPGFYANVTELGLSSVPGSGNVRGATSYRAYDRRARARERALEILPKYSVLETLPEGAELSLPSASQDLFLSLFTLERLPMSELYMAVAEMRRTLKPGAYAALASIHPGDSWWERLVTKWQARRGRGNPLQLAHYLSPEDWETIKEGAYPLPDGRRAGLLLLRRRHAEAW